MTETFYQHALYCSQCGSQPWAACRIGYALIFGEYERGERFVGDAPEHGGKVVTGFPSDAVASNHATSPILVEAGSAMVQHLDADGLATCVTNINSNQGWAGIL